MLPLDKHGDFSFGWKVTWLEMEKFCSSSFLRAPCRDFSFLLIPRRCYHATHSSARLKHQPRVSTVRAPASWMAGSTRERWVVDVNTAEVIMKCNNSKPSTDTPSLGSASLEMCCGCDLGVLLQILSGKLRKFIFKWKHLRWSLKGSVKSLQVASFGKTWEAGNLPSTCVGY